MRVLFLTNLFPPHVLGGYEILCGEVASAWARKGHEVHVLASDHGVGSPVDEEVGGVRVMRRLRLEVPFGEPYTFGVGRRWSTGRHNGGVAREVLGSLRPEAVFAWSQLRLTLAPAREAARAGVPVAWTYNDGNILSYRDAPFSRSPRGWARWQLSRLLPGGTLRGLPMDVATAISECLLEDLRAGGLPLPRARVIHQGIPVDLFPPRELPGQIGQPMRVLYAGQLHEYKGVHVLLGAAGLLAARHGSGCVVITIAGDGEASYVERLRSMAREAGVACQFLGRVPREELPAVYRAHDAFVFPSTWREPFGLTHLEAMASGLPVVSTLAGGQREFLVPGENCLAFETEDAAGLCDALGRLREDASLGPRLAEAGMRLVRERFTLARYVDDLESFVAEAVAA